MFPFRHSSIFRSRWIALFWAAGIVWTAVDFAGSPDEDQANGSALNIAAMMPADKLLDK
jgi:hypothetical protein